MIVLALAAMAFAQTMTPPDDPRWLVVARNTNGEYAIHPDSIVRRGDRVRVLIRMRRFDREAVGSNLSVMRYDYDCRTSTVRPEAADFYDADGRPGGGFVERPEDVRDVAVAPASPNAMISAYLCSGPPARVSTLLTARIGRPRPAGPA